MCCILSRSEPSGVGFISPQHQAERHDSRGFVPHGRHRLHCMDFPEGQTGEERLKADSGLGLRPSDFTSLRTPSSLSSCRPVGNAPNPAIDAEMAYLMLPILTQTVIPRCLLCQ